MKKQKHDYILLAGLTVAALFIHGYHLGVEDQAIYLPGIRKILDPSLYPYDSELFLPQTNATMFGNFIAFTVRYTHLSCSAVIFIYYVLSLYLVLLGCLMLARRLFHERYAQWAGVCLVASLLTIPVAGTALYLVDEYLHPRALATFAVLFALLAAFPGETPEEPVDRSRLHLPHFLWMLFWLAFATLFQIQMAFYGALLLAILLVKMPRRAESLMAAAILPLRSLWEPASAAWRKAARTRTENYLLLWHWYEWLGVAGPLAILEWFRRLARRHNLPRVEYLSRRLTLFGLFGLAAGLILTTPPALERLTPYQPMRTFQMLYLLFFLMAGALIGKWILRKSLWRWLAFFVPLSLAMCYAQLQLYPASPHIEWPGVQDPNPWVQAFLWIRHNTPKDAYFALSPHFMELPGEDYHGFRAFAERSRMADVVKDPGVVSLFPNIGNTWLKQVTALKGWRHFTLHDFQRLKQQFGVDWVVIQQPGVPGLDCVYQNSRVRVCRIE
ncbi:MAG: hypothetical protein M1404_02400 [Acidobacteria bacterium]|nr:hypothetical protein [Acidobacteriota bacterium]